MKWKNLRSRRIKKYRVLTTDSKHNFPISPNLLRYAGMPEEINRVWVSDITYLKVPDGWLYLCIVMDLRSRKIIGWALRDHLKISLVIEALQMAIHRRRPDKGLIFHSDRGSQYASNAVRELIEKHDFLQSMSRRGNCWYSAWAESWFATLKLELGSKFENAFEANEKLFQFIEAFYNRQRLHSYLNYQSPEIFERKAA